MMAMVAVMSGRVIGDKRARAVRRLRGRRLRIRSGFRMVTMVAMSVGMIGHGELDGRAAAGLRRGRAHARLGMMTVSAMMRRPMVRGGRIVRARRRGAQREAEEGETQELPTEFHRRLLLVNAGIALADSIAIARTA